MLNDETCEKFVVGTAVSRGNMIGEIRSVVNVDCFTNHIYRSIFEAAIAIDDRGEVPDMISIHEYLSKKGAQVNVNDIIGVSESCIIGSPLPYTRRLKELYSRRALMQVGQRLINASTNEVDPIDELLGTSREIIDKMSNSNSQGVTTLKSATKELMQKISDNLSGKSPSGTKIGFPMIDKKGGFHPADLVIIAAETSVGKTSLATSIAKNVMFQGDKVAFYSLEMMAHQLAARIISMASKVSSSTMLYDKPTSYDMDRINEAIQNIPLDNLLIDDKATSNIDSIIGSIRNLHKKYGIKGAIVDYLQILNVNTSGKLNKEQLMAEVARRLKNLAKDLGIWIVALSQLNRDSENPMPTINRLRDSGQIAEAADIVMLIYRPEIYGKKYPKPFEDKSTHNTAMIDVAKGRNIGVFRFLCSFIPELTLFVDDSVIEIEEDSDRPF